MAAVDAVLVVIYGDVAAEVVISAFVASLTRVVAAVDAILVVISGDVAAEVVISVVVVSGHVVGCFVVVAGVGADVRAPLLKRKIMIFCAM